ncbi:MAG TPA: sugar-binding protein [Verrucomicrobiae bacterium]|nr:sugar-binding protein [Verrucomicrobiae bacterium]
MCLAALLGTSVPRPCPAAQSESDNLIVNGDFKLGFDGWGYEQWIGKAVPGFIDKKDHFEGEASLKMTDTNRYIAQEIKIDDPESDYMLSFALKAEHLPPSSGYARLGIEGRGWLGSGVGQSDLVRVGGTQDWKRYEFLVRAGDLQGAKKATVFFYTDQIGNGALGVDAVRFQRRSSGESGCTLTGDTSEPTLSTFAQGLPVRLTFHVHGLKDGGQPLRLTISVVDEHEKQLTAKELGITADADGNWTGSSTAPSERLGFYRVYASLSNGTKLKALGSRREGFLTYAVIPDPSLRKNYGEKDSYFGMQGGFGPWGGEAMANLGARWLLDSRFDWRALEPDHAGQFTDEKAKTLKDSPPFENWTTFSFPTLFMAPQWSMVPGTYAYNTGRLTPEGEKAWAAYCRHVAMVYAAITPEREEHIYQITWEPIQPWGFKGTDQDLVRIYEIAYPALHAVDPNAVVAGPCRGVDKNELERTTTLLKFGLGKYVDAYSVHPYFSITPERDGMMQIMRGMKAVLREYTGRDLPMFGTEQGWSTKEDPANDLQHAQGLIRQNLITFGEGYRFNMAFYIVDYRMSGQSGYGYYYNLVDGVPWGPAKAGPRPIVPAYAALSFLLDGYKSVGAIESLGQTAWGYAFQRGDDVRLALWDYGDQPSEVAVPVGVQSVRVYDWMGNGRTTDTPDGMLKLTLGPEPVYVVAVSPQLWGKNAEHLINVDQRPVVLVDGASITVEGTVSAPSNRPLSGTLTLEPDSRLGLKPMDQPVNLAKGQAKHFAFVLEVPGTTGSGTYPLKLAVRESGTVAGLAGMKLQLAPAVNVVAVKPALNKGSTIVLKSQSAAKQSGKLEVKLQRVIHGAPRPDLTMIDLPEGKVQLEDVPGGQSEVTFTLSANGEQPVTMAFPKADINPLASYRLLVQVAPDSGRSSSTNAPIDFLTATRRSQAPRVDGNLDDWASIPALPLRGKEAVIRSPEEYKGDADLSAQLRFAWDSKALYIAADVTDDVYLQPETGDMIWRGDCLQMAFDVAPHKSANTEMTVALTQKGLEAVRALSFDPVHVPLGPVKDNGFELAVRKTSTGLVYEIAVPWSSLGMSQAPEAGQAIGISLAVNDLDSTGQKDPKALGVFGGIYPVKDPDQFGVLLLGADDSSAKDGGAEKGTTK